MARSVFAAAPAAAGALLLAVLLAAPLLVLTQTPLLALSPPLPSPSECEVKMFGKYAKHPTLHTAEIASDMNEVQLVLQKAHMLGAVVNGAKVTTCGPEVKITVDIKTDGDKTVTVRRIGEESDPIRVEVTAYLAYVIPSEMDDINDD